MKKFLIFLASIVTFLVTSVVNIVLLTIVYNTGIVPVLMEVGYEPINMGYDVMTMIWFIYVYLYIMFGGSSDNKITVEDGKDLALAIGNIFGKLIGRSFIVLIIWVLSVIIF